MEHLLDLIQNIAFLNIYTLRTLQRQEETTKTENPIILFTMIEGFEGVFNNSTELEQFIRQIDPDEFRYSFPFAIVMPNLLFENYHEQLIQAIEKVINKDIKECICYDNMTQECIMEFNHLITIAGNFNSNFVVLNSLLY